MSNRNELSIPIMPTSLVKVTYMNHLVEVQHMEKMNWKNHIQKLDKHRYLVLETGEIKEYEHIENRNQSYNSLRQTFKKLRYLINNNFVGAPNELHVTLTYAENMTDTKRLHTDFKNFILRLRYYFSDKSTIDYINVVEPQQRGAWHCHMLLRVNDLEKVYIASSELEKLWGHGFIKIKSLKDVDNIGAYLSAYLTDIEVSEDSIGAVIRAVSEEQREVVTKKIEGKEKKYIKGGRLHMYPPGMNLIRKSQGIRYPERITKKFKDIPEIKNVLPHYVRTVELNDEAKKYTNTITHIDYNLKRK